MKRNALALASLGPPMLAFGAQFSGVLHPRFEFLLGLVGAVGAGVFIQLISRHAGVRKAILAAAAALAALAVIEAIYLYRYYTAAPQVLYRGGDRSFTGSDDRFGYVPDTADAEVRAIRRGPGGATVYDVVYTLRDRIRVTRGDSDGPCTVLFMIDSHAFGEGLDDADTLANRFSEATGFRLNVVNLGFPGYGPHQMLSWLEDRRAHRFIRSPVAAAYYTTPGDHPSRLRGFTHWSRFDPRYALIDGSVRRTGRLHGLPAFAGSWRQFRRDLLGFLRGSTAFADAFGTPELQDPVENEYTRALFVATLARAHELLQTQFGVPLTMLDWYGHPSLVAVRTELSRRGLVILDSEALLGPRTVAHRIPGDGHPSALANRAAGQALARRFGGCR